MHSLVGHHNVLFGQMDRTCRNPLRHHRGQHVDCVQLCTLRTGGPPQIPATNLIRVRLDDRHERGAGLNIFGLLFNEVVSGQIWVGLSPEPVYLRLGGNVGCQSL